MSETEDIPLNSTPTVIDYSSTQAIYDTNKESEYSLQSTDKGFMKNIFPTGFLKELKFLLKLACPIVLSQFFQILMSPVAMIFCGHLNDKYALAGVALAISVINVSSICFAMGLGTAVDTYMAQAYGSAKKYKMGVILQRVMIIFMIFCSLCVATHLHVERILILLYQEAGISKIAGDYVILFIPGEICFFLYTCISKYLHNQNIVVPCTISCIIANIINIFLHWLLVFYYNLKVIGSAIALSVSYCWMLAILLFYVGVSRVFVDSWTGFSYQALYGWWSFIKLAIPGALMICLEWWGFEIGVIAAGLLGPIQLGSQSLVLQLDSLWFQIPMGFQIATSVRTGQYMGGGNKLNAITLCRVAIISISVLSIFVIVFFTTCRKLLPSLLTNVWEVVDLSAKLLPIIGIYMFFDGIATVCKGILHGTGRQRIGAIIMFVFYYIFALPIGLSIMFTTSLETAAYWYALCGNLIIQSIILLIIFHFTNWDKMVSESKDRIHRLSFMSNSIFTEGTSSDHDMVFDALDNACELKSNTAKSHWWRVLIALVLCIPLIISILLKILISNNKM